MSLTVKELESGREVGRMDDRIIPWQGFDPSTACEIIDESRNRMRADIAKLKALQEETEDLLDALEKERAKPVLDLSKQLSELKKERMELERGLPEMRYEYERLRDEVLRLSEQKHLKTITKATNITKERAVTLLGDGDLFTVVTWLRWELTRCDVNREHLFSVWLDFATEFVEFTSGEMFSEGIKIGFTHHDVAHKRVYKCAVKSGHDV